MNQDSHEQQSAQTHTENEDSEPQVLAEPSEDAPEVLEGNEEAQNEQDEDDAAQWSDEFSPEELAELFDGEENVPSAAAEPAADVETVEEEDPGAGERLQKLLARTGVASRRAAEELIRTGRVTVNGEVVTELGRRARPGRDVITLDGRTLKIGDAGSTVVVLHKPRGTVSTKSDPQGRATVMSLLPKRLAHLHPIGRLDFDTAGLLLLTDDGELTNLLLHPSHGVEKRYHARVRGVIEAKTIERLQKGVRLEDGVTLPCRVRVKAQTPSNALLEITLREGRNRQVRRMMTAVGHPVSALRRVKVGPLDLAGLAVGAYRELLPGEVHLLKKAAMAPKPALKSARPFGYKPRPSKAAAPGFQGREQGPEARPGKSPAARYDRPRDERAPRDRAAGPQERRRPDERANERFGDRRGSERFGEERSARPTNPRASGGRPFEGRANSANPSRDDRHPRDARTSPGGARDSLSNFRPERPARDAGPNARPERPFAERPFSDRPRPDRPREGGSANARTNPNRPAANRDARPQAPRSSAGSSARPEGARPAREGGERKAVPSKLAKRIEKRWE